MHGVAQCKVQLTLEIPSSFDQRKHPRGVILTPPPRYLCKYLPNDWDFHRYV